ncbi:MAG: hypothetical protein QOH76_3695 [Thermoleophilaceae bacterium]|jgi:hypothetical protein|nr:hypothetical protein [Thermoleophilaceae bacterium]
MAIGVGHTLWGTVAYRDAVREIVRAGVVDSVGDGIFRRSDAHGPRAAGFWFLMVGPLVGLCGHLVEAADRAGDDRALRASGRAILGIGALGAAVIPRSGFWGALPIGYWLERRGGGLRRG